jgi:topoisomerase-4 subunit A
MAKSKKDKDKIDAYVETILDEKLEDIVSERFGRYSKYIIQDRALPDVRDGLKPVQRRILYSMYKLGMFPSKPYKKSARIVGDVIGKYHPHGDQSVYDAMVRMAQPWKMLSPLIDMHGNKGSIDGDTAAAMRYTEARMAIESEHLLQDIEKRTVDFIPNFDDEEYEPVVLPAKYPNLLVNGASGISAGYATEIPPHNPSEIIDLVIARINRPTMTIESVLKIVKGPDFPTGGIVQGVDEIQKAFETGRGRVIVRSKEAFEGQSIIITEIPYEVNKANLVRKIDDYRNGKQLDGIKEVRDESDREGLRIVIDIKDGFDPQSVYNFLLKKTELTKSYNYNMVAINNKRPELMGIIEIVDAYIVHQKEVVTNRSNYELKRAQKRLHIVEGIIKLLDILDEVIALIRASKDKKDAKNSLVKAYDFSEEQSEAIVTLQLYKLSNTDIKLLVDEKNDLNKTIMSLKAILSNEDELEKVIKKELRDIKKIIGKERKTIVEEEIEKIVINEEELIGDEQVVVGLSCDGYIKAVPPKSYIHTKQTQTKDNDSMLFVREISTLSHLLIFTDKGNYIFVPVFKIPMFKWKDLGTHINNLSTMDTDENIIKVLHVENFDEELYVLFTTKNNLVKLTKLSDFYVKKYSKALKAIKLSKGNEVVSIDVTTSIEKEVLILASNGQGLRFELSEIPVTGTNAIGVKGMSLTSKQTLSTGIILEDHHVVNLLTNRGTVKRIDPNVLTKKRRTNKGEQLLKIVKSNPFKVIDGCLMNATQYKERATIYINTSTELVEINAFDIKENMPDAGTKVLNSNQGKPLFINIESIEEHDDIQPITEYKRFEIQDIHQMELFEM